MNNLRKRQFSNVVAFAASTVATLIGLAALFAILWVLLSNGIKGMSWQVFTQTTPAPGSSGGLANAIFGSVLMTLMGILIGAPIGILAGTYIAEYGRRSALSTVVRFINDVLLSAPSILIGLFVYTLVVARVGHFSAIAGAIALGIISIPVMVRTTEDMLNLVPSSIRDGSAGLGAHPWRTITSIVYPAARNGMITGLMLAIARISGESAPLMFTVLNNQFWSTDVTRPMANLPMTIYTFAMSPYADWRSLAWKGAFIITTFILFLSVLARSLSRLFGKHQSSGE
ncbi:MAG: phosphate ABC transporter permease PstA [Steroidobacter sp.]